MDKYISYFLNAKSTYIWVSWSNKGKGVQQIIANQPLQWKLDLPAMCTAQRLKKVFKMLQHYPAVYCFCSLWNPKASIYLVSVLPQAWEWNRRAFPMMVSQWKIQTQIMWWYLIWFLYLRAALLWEETSPLRGGGRLFIYQSVLSHMLWPILLLKIALLRSQLQIEFCCFIAHCSLMELHVAYTQALRN